jgi:hypothetical protein
MTTSVVDICRELQLRRIYRSPAIALADFYLGNASFDETLPAFGAASARDAFLAFAEAQAWTEAEWASALIVIGYTNLNSVRATPGAGQ